MYSVPKYPTIRNRVDLNLDYTSSPLLEYMQQCCLQAILNNILTCDLVLNLEENQHCPLNKVSLSGFTKDWSVVSSQILVTVFTTGVQK